MLKSILGALIGALFGALIFSASPAIASEHWIPIANHILGDVDSVKVEKNAQGFDEIHGHFRSDSQNHYDFDASINLLECVQSPNGGRLDLAYSDESHEVIHWRVDGDHVYDSIGHGLCVFGKGYWDNLKGD